MSPEGFNCLTWWGGTDRGFQLVNVMVGEKSLANRWII